MVNYLRHMATAFVIFAIMVTLYVNLYSEVETAYNLTRTGTDDEGYNVMERIDHINLISSLNETSTAMYKLASPQNAFDLIGAMALAGWGVLKIIASMALFPAEILGVMTGFYYIPPVVVTGLIVISTLSVGFIILSAWMKERL